MSFLDWVFGKTRKMSTGDPHLATILQKLVSQNDTTFGTCDLCSRQTDYGEGYVFYSDTIQPRSSGEGDIGSMHFCNACTDTYITDERFKRPLAILSMTIDELPKDITKGRKFLQEANAIGVIRVCKAHGFTAAQAKSKGREFALILWQDKQRCIHESIEFWKSTLGSDPPYTLANCIEVMAGFYVQRNTNMVVGPVSGIMLRKALATEVTCIDCKQPFKFQDSIDHQAGAVIIGCPLCKAYYAKFNIKNQGHT